MDKIFNIPMLKVKTITLFTTFCLLADISN